MWPDSEWDQNMSLRKFLTTPVSQRRTLRFTAAAITGLGLGIAAFAIFGTLSRPILALSGVLLAIAGFAIWSVDRRAQMLHATASELNASQDRLREVSNFRQQFLANMSHEFRTPLNAIQGFAQAILHRQNEMSAEQISDYLRIIEKSACDLGALTDNVLDLSKLDAQKSELSVSDVDFTRLVCNAVGQHSALAGERNIKLNTEIDEDWIVRADPRGIRRCINSLVSNALKFSQDGDYIDVRAYRWGRRSFVVEVTDRGCGIAQEDLDNIWMVYARSAMTKKTDRIGAGLGLAITRALMDAHNGYIEIDSEEGRGTTVRLCFPNTMIVSSGYELQERADARAIAV
jgi:signal transduction histidine kinase